MERGRSPVSYMYALVRAYMYLARNLRPSVLLREPSQLWRGRNTAVDSSRRQPRDLNRQQERIPA